MILKNTTGSDITVTGRIIPSAGSLSVDSGNQGPLSSDDTLLALIASGDVVVNDGTSDLGVSDGIDLLKGFFPKSVNIADKDSDTLGIQVTNKYAPDGFYQRLHEVEFTTAIVGGNLHDKDMNNQDTGYSSVDFYEDINGVETLMVNPTQLDLTTKCIRTDYKFMPSVDYMVMSGIVTHQSIPTEEVYMWGVMLDVDPALNAYGIYPIEVLGGGMAMSFVDARKPVGLKGVNGTMLYHAGVNAPSGFVQLPPGMGTNRIRFMMRHGAGFQHRFQAIFEIFKA